MNSMGAGECTQTRSIFNYSNQNKSKKFHSQMIMMRYLVVFLLCINCENDCWFNHDKKFSSFSRAGVGVQGSLETSHHTPCMYAAM